MKTSRLLVLGLAVAAAGGAFILASTPKPAPVETAAPAPPPPTDAVLVAAHDVAPGGVVGDPDLVWQTWPKAALGPAMITQAGSPAARDELRGTIARNGLLQGEPVHREQLVKGDAGFMSSILPSGMRAVAITIDSQGATTAGGFIQPKDRVDVLRTYQQSQGLAIPGGNPTFVTETLLRNVKVLAIGQNIQEKNGQPVVVGSNATLELDPVQAETIILAQRTGQLSLTLRSMQDINTADAAAHEKDGNLTVVRYGVLSEGALR